jgi:hypothetical protein
MDVEQRDEEITRFFTFLFCLLAIVFNLRVTMLHNPNDLDMGNR